MCNPHNIKDVSGGTYRVGDINCRNCEGACCKAQLAMNMTLEEAVFLIEAGTNLYRVELCDTGKEEDSFPIKMDLLHSRVYVDRDDESHMRAAGLGRYILLSDCGYLQTDSEGWQYCGAYDRRPQACRDMEVAGPRCQVIRFLAGVDPVEDTDFDLRDGLEQ